MHLDDWTPDTIITPEMAAKACRFFNLPLEEAIYKSPDAQPFTFDGCSSIDEFLKAILSPNDYTTVTQLVCRPHDLGYGVCTSAKRRLELDEKFKADLKQFAPYLDNFQVFAAFHMIRRYGTLCQKWAPGFALKPELRVKVA